MASGFFCLSARVGSVVPHDLRFEYGSLRSEMLCPIAQCRGNASRKAQTASTFVLLLSDWRLTVGNFSLYESWLTSRLPLMNMRLGVGEELGARLSLRKWCRSRRFAEVFCPTPVPDFRHILKMLPNVYVVLVQFPVEHVDCVRCLGSQSRHVF